MAIGILWMMMRTPRIQPRWIPFLFVYVLILSNVTFPCSFFAVIQDLRIRSRPTPGTGYTSGLYVATRPGVRQTSYPMAYRTGILRDDGRPTT
ncbi:hypothetical protein T440DRAFT_275415 [Plenodomus tracheiphilus IPT5]|uniref:Uncharacterized protein n=1 Tax=Plenodomus tracheiphilus IPT5 TaxID=1408161 RepID=A0A6A7BJZ4_9PLEO|nr:hypothetical protein T440DRAFT_275415 [Plenodomus tracheiphilus IPT5]